LSFLTKIFGSNDGTIYSIDKKGKVLWEFKTEDKITAQPTIGTLDKSKTCIRFLSLPQLGIVRNDTFCLSFRAVFDEKRAKSEHVQRFNPWGLPYYSSFVEKAAPIMPASFCNCAGIIFALVDKYGKNFLLL